MNGLFGRPGPPQGPLWAPNVDQSAPRGLQRVTFDPLFIFMTRALIEGRFDIRALRIILVTFGALLVDFGLPGATVGAQMLTLGTTT